MTRRSSRFLHPVFNFLMIPWSMGCSTDVQLAGKNLITTLESLIWGWLGALSTNSKIFLYFFAMLRFKSFSHSSNMIEFILAFLLCFQVTGSFETSLMFLKHRGFLLFPIISGMSFSVPDVLEQRRIVSRSFGILVPWLESLFWTRDLVGNAL